MFAPLFSFAIIALSVVSASPIKRAAPTLLLPSTASLWLQFEFSDTDAFVTFDGLVWQWAGEDEPGPPIAQFAIELVPGSMQPSGTDALVRLSLAGTECRVVGDFFDCSGADMSAPVAVFRATVKTDDGGFTQWYLSSGQPAFSTQRIENELRRLAVTPKYDNPRNVYLRTDAF